MAGATICAGTITTNPLSVGTTRCGIAIASRTRAQLSACPRSEEARTTASLGTSAVTGSYDSHRVHRGNAFSAAAGWWAEPEAGSRWVGTVVKLTRVVWRP